MTNSDVECSARKIVESFQHNLSEASDVDEPLDFLLAATSSRATGLWKLSDRQLIQMGFRAVSNMSSEVQSTFAYATREVSLEQVRLGIVKAVLTNEPTVATIDPNESQLGESASWLARFEARNSLAVPIAVQEKIVGVIAISSAEELHSSSDAWNIISLVAGHLGNSLTS